MEDKKIYLSKNVKLTVKQKEDAKKQSAKLAEKEAEKLNKLHDKLADEPTELKMPEGFMEACNETVFVFQTAVKEIKTEGGIILPPATQTGAEEDSTNKVGIVMGIGPNVKTMVHCEPDDPSAKINPVTGKYFRPLKIGDRVIFNVYVTRGISFEGRVYMMMVDTDIQAVLPSDNMKVIKSERIDRRRAAVELKESEIAGHRGGLNKKRGPNVN